MDVRDRKSEFVFHYENSFTCTVVSPYCYYHERYPHHEDLNTKPSTTSSTGIRMKLISYAIHAVCQLRTELHHVSPRKTKIRQSVCFG